MGMTRTLAEYAVSLQYPDLPSEVVAQAKLFILDWLGVTLGGSREPLARILEKVVCHPGEAPEATVMGRKFKSTLLNACLINGSMAHALDYDDYLDHAVLHGTPPLLPGVIALAEKHGFTGRDILTAYVAGFEVEARAVWGIGQELNESGFHTTGVAGHFAAATAAGKLLNLNVAQMEHALGIAGTQAAGMTKSIGTMCKPFHAGKAAMNGTLAALLAQEGFTGSTDVFDGPSSFGETFIHQDLSANVEDLGKRYRLMDNGFKLHASCRLTHPTIEAGLDLQQKHQIPPHLIEEVTCYLSAFAMKMVDQSAPATGLQAKFSTQHCAALALVERRAGEDLFADDTFNGNNVVREVRNRVKLITDPSLERLQMRMEVKTGSKDIFREDIMALRGEPSLPASVQDIEDKFKALTRVLYPEGQIQDMINVLNGLENLPNIEPILQIITNL